MFMGHYGPAVLDTRRGPGIPLWHAFLLVQAIDVFWAVLTIFGIEGSAVRGDGVPIFRIAWSHSLLSAVLISLAVGWTYGTVRRGIGRRGRLVAAGLVFSHWVLDLVVHRPDLPLYPGSGVLLGFGVWDFPLTAYALEIGLLAAGLLFWQRATRAHSRANDAALLAVFLFMAVLQFVFITAPGLAVQNGTFDPEAGLDGPMLVLSALAVFVVLAVAVRQIERGRTHEAPR